MMRALLCTILLASSTTVVFAQSHEKFGDGEKSFREVKAMLLKEYVDELSEDDLYRGAVSGMLQAAANRKWDMLISPGEYADMHSDLGGQMVGIGVELDASHDKEAVTILGTFPGTPAEKAELRAGDRLLKVNDTAVKQGNGMDVIRLIRGKAGTKVTLTILRDEQVLVKTLVRAPINVSAVSSATLPDGTAVVWIRQFSEKTPSLLREQLSALMAKKPRGIVVDLRHNQGGLLDKMIESVSLLLPKGATVALEEVRGKKQEIIKASGEPVVHGLPVAVLVNGETASGAELFAAALRDDLGARIVGKRTTGKWNVQRVENLGNGYAIKFTVGLFKTAKGQAPDGKGLDPDVPVDGDDMAVARAQRMSDGAQRLAADPQLRAAVALLK
jgi:carboxyl-terminal processing protease